MASHPEHSHFGRGINSSSQQRLNTGIVQQPPPGFGRDQMVQTPYVRRSLTDFQEGYALALLARAHQAHAKQLVSANPYGASPQRRDPRDYTGVPGPPGPHGARVDPYRVPYLPPAAAPIATPDPTAIYMRSSFTPVDAAFPLDSQFSLPSSYGGQDMYGSDPESPSVHESLDYSDDPGRRRGEGRGEGRGEERGRGQGRFQSQRRPSNRDIFDGPHQLLPPPSPRAVAMQERELPHLPTNLDVQEQDEILNQVNDILSKCAFDFVAKYQFPIPIEPDKRQVRVPADREWTEWVYLLKRLATKRRIPYRVLYNNQIKQLTTVLENSLEMRHAAKHQSRPLKDDRNVLQLISAGIQVAKILKDATAMEYLDRIYVRTEMLIQDRKERNRRVFPG